MKDVAKEAFELARNLAAPVTGLAGSIATLMLVSAASPANANESWNLEALDLTSALGLVSVGLLVKGFGDTKTLMGHSGAPVKAAAPQSVANGPA